MWNSNWMIAPGNVLEWIGYGATAVIFIIATLRPDLPIVHWGIFTLVCSALLTNDRQEERRSIRTYQAFRLSEAHGTRRHP